ncbi:secretion system protein [Haloplanus rubicundus]|uniref:Secretion system protein n=1 Tax=Haloplanus rubicundus TaxID=1547898 RepID=A0A345E5G4_9EURY|nr:type II secretion system F family protein [Haloplanus rubicundus]AXG07436.1 secretion system protein [Haloplanus rubicundus]AXG10851.1 secretion system protein [Haloplanus rubicundus]
MIGPLAPLVLVVVLALPVVLSPVSRRADLLVSRLAVPIFGDYVGRSSRRSWQLERLRATHVGTTHRVFASRTLFISGLAGVCGAILGVYVATWLVDLFSISRESILAVVPPALSFLAGLTRLQDLTLLGLFVLFLFFGATLGTALALGTYWARWAYLDQLANARASEIEATLPRTIAFVYALSRSGMPFPKVLDTLARNEDIYGEAAREVGVAVRDMNTFSTDILTAVERTAERTPSEGLSEFADNLASVLGSGRNLSSFLRDQYERYQEEAEAQQEQYLELVSTLAEVYVTVLVAGPLFFITVLVVIGLVIEDTISIVRFVGYIGIPLASAGFVVYIDSLTQHETALTDVSRDVGNVLGVPGGDGAAARSDGGVAVFGDDGGDGLWRRNAERLAAYDRLRALRSWANAPLRSVLEHPWISFVVTVPLGVGWVLYRAVPIPLGPSALQTLDLPVIEATIFVMTVFAVLHEVHKRRVRAIERAVPDFLSRLASVNEAGMSVVESLRRVADTDLGGLEAEVERTRRDVRWGADVSTAFRRFAARTRVRMVAQAVTLITNAMSASGDIAPVLRIAADEAQATRRLRRERQQEMLTYILVIYISVFVFLGIIAALTVAFIPAVQEAGGTAAPAANAPGTGVTGAFTGTDVNTSAYELLFFHISAVQAVCSGLIAGQLAEGGVADGVKHAAGLLVLTYLVFAFVLL